MTTNQCLKDAISILTYKPGWEFAVENFRGLSGDMIVALNIKAQATCIDSGEPITIDRSFPVAHNLDSFAACAFVYECIYAVEMHEIKEWLKFRGVRFFPEIHDKDGY